MIAAAIDRRSRDQADVAAIYKQLMFAGVQTPREGWIEELHVGLKGTTNQLFLKDRGPRMGGDYVAGWRPGFPGVGMRTATRS